MATKVKKKKAGRKALPIGEKKQQLNIYVKQRIIDNAGGKEAAEVFAEQSLEANFSPQPRKIKTK